MSDTEKAAAREPAMPPPDNIPPPRHGCLTGPMVLVGIIFLLPGLCTLAVTKDLHADPLFGVIAIIAFTLGIGGIALIWLALRGQQR
jgi:hypothetical protein